MQLSAGEQHTLAFETQGRAAAISLDEKLLRSMLSNLLSNAIKYSPEGGTITLSLVFALESGVFVHNCGLIVNVTPFEPEWEGYVTLEISNTTPLPAKVYAFEGIAQVLFFEGDEPCDISYADRKGKYQKQETIVLPRI